MSLEQYLEKLNLYGKVIDVKNNNVLIRTNPNYIEDDILYISEKLGNGHNDYDIIEDRYAIIYL